MPPAAGTIVLDAPRPVKGLHDGRWLVRWLGAYRRDGERWRGYARYIAGVGMTYHHWREQGERRGLDTAARMLAHCPPTVAAL